jgi:hypothetical protein
MTFNTDRIVSLSAMVVGVGSLVTLAYQAGLTRQTQHASVLPYLYISLMSNSQNGVALQLSNSGIGPALIDDVAIHYEGRDIPADPFDFYVSLSEEHQRNQPGVDKVQKGRLIPAGATIQMISFAPGPRGEQTMLPEMLKLFEIAEVPRAWYVGVKATDTHHAVVDVTYSSVYGDRWRVRSDRIVPEPVR